MKDYGKEEVLVVPAEKISLWEGIKPASQETLELCRKNSFLISRNRAEGNSYLRQIIPYCTLIHIDEKGMTHLFYAKRKPEADRELSGKWTIGLGGHINPKDRHVLYRGLCKRKIDIVGLEMDNSFDAMILNCAARELKEEVRIDWDDVIEIKYYALISTSSDFVSKDHLGVVLLFMLRTMEVEIRQEEFTKGGFFTEEEFLIYADYSDWLRWLHTSEGIKMEEHCRGIISLCTPHL